MNRGFTIWFTGLSGSGKTTTSELVYRDLRQRHDRVELLDGDAIRPHLSPELGYSKHDRDQHVRRVGWVAELLTRNDVIVLVALISPYAAVRQEVREKIGRFIEVYCDAPITALVQRDPKGLYQKARDRQLQQFTGISDPYEAPRLPQVHLRTDLDTPEHNAQKVIRVAQQLGLLAAHSS